MAGLPEADQQGHCSLGSRVVSHQGSPAALWHHAVGERRRDARHPGDARALLGEDDRAFLPPLLPPLGGGTGAGGAGRAKGKGAKKGDAGDERGTHPAGAENGGSFGKWVKLVETATWLVPRDGIEPPTRGFS